VEQIENMYARFVRSASSVVAIYLTIATRMLTNIYRTYVLQEASAADGWQSSFTKMNAHVSIRSQHAEHMRASQGADPGAPLSTADVTCSADCVVYSWCFDDLYALLHSNAHLEGVVESAISADLVEKLVSRDVGQPVLYAPRERYLQALTGVLSNVPKTGKVSLKCREYLREVRDEYSISEADHHSMVRSLGWTVEQYNSGEKETTSSSRQYVR
jgi:hypothetical protein